MTASFETIINQYMEGKASRADVESLRLRLDLDQTERDEIESVLRLTDELADAARTTPPVPAGAIDRLAERLGAYISSKAGELDQAVVDRIDRQLRGRPILRQDSGFPDVLAATVDDQNSATKKIDPDKHI